MADTKDINKSEEIRKAGAELKAKGQKVSPKIIIDILAKKGITVSSPQCSMVLKKAGHKPRKRRKAGEAAKAAPAKVSRKQGSVSIEDVIAAKKIATGFGGADRLVAALKALERLS